jgi:hypothetical protein
MKSLKTFHDGLLPDEVLDNFSAGQPLDSDSDDEVTAT